MFSRYMDNFDFKSRFRILKGGKISLVVSSLLGSVIIASAAPTGGNVTSGTATISQTGNTTNINQTTSKASINWQNFNIASNETVNFNQPNVNSITLNRVIGNEKSIINGALNANGQVWILNSNGILFSKDAKVNTSGLVASTAELSDKDFQDGNYNFKNSKLNSVVNLGTIEVANNGYVVLASNEVRNSGTIKAIKGKVYLSGNREYTINLNGNSIVNLIVTKGVLDAMVENSGTIVANGGEIYLTTNAVNELLKGVVNNTGIIEANSLDDVTGKVEVFAHGGTANVGGEIKAEGGFVETSGKDFKIQPNAKVKAKTWLIDPVNITIDSTLAETISTALGSGDVTITTSGNNTPSTTSGESGTNGDITVASAISWSSNKSLTLNAYRNIAINADITATNALGKLVLEYGQGAVASENTDTYDFGLTSSGFTGKINLQSGQNFDTKLGNNGTVTSYTVINDVASLQNINTSSTTLGGNYALGSNIDLNGVTWTTIGNVSNNFTGKFDGLGHKISNLVISNSSSDYQGMFGYVVQPAEIRNIGLTDGSISGHDYVGGLVGKMTGSLSNVYTKNVAVSGNEYVGGLVGNSNATISNAHTEGTGLISGNYLIGGLVGSSSGDISNSYSSVNVKGINNVGGLVGINSTKTIKTSYATGSVESTTGSAGGLVGYNASNGAILNSYATGSVSGGTAGGLVARNGAPADSFWCLMYNMCQTTPANITDSYAIGAVSGTTKGGLVGVNYAGSISGFYDSTVNNSGMSDSSYGKTTTQMQTLLTYSGWDIAGVDGSYPTLSNGAHVWNMIASATPLTYTLSDITSGYTYSGSSVLLTDLWSTASIFAGTTYDGWSLGTDYNFIYGGNIITSFTNAGTYDNISISILKSGFTTASSGNTVGSLVINKKALTVSGLTIDSKTYNGSNSATVLTAGSIDKVTGDDVDFNTVATFNNENVESTKTVDLDYTLSGTKAGNYTLVDVTCVATSALINAKALTVSGLTIDSKTYNGSNSATVLTAGSIDKVTGDDVDFNTVATFNNENVESTKTVNLDYTLSGTKAGNYTLVDATDVATSALINAKALTITADTKTKTYGDVTPNLTYSLSENLIGSDTLSGNLSTTSQYSDVGIYDISSSLANSNYSINFEGNNKLTITKKDINILGLSGINKTYDGNRTAILNGTAVLDSNSIVNGDSISISGTAVGNFADANAGNNKAITVSGMTINGAKAGNYNIGVVTGLTANISKKTLTVSGLTIGSKTYDGTNSATVSNVGIIDKIGNDDVSFGTVATFNNKNVEANKTVNLDYTLSGNDAINYSLVDVSGITTNALINAKTTTAQVSLKTSEVTGVPVKLDGILTNELVSQGAKIIVLDASNNDVTELAKEGKIQPGKYSVKAINDNTNYALNSNTVELTINSALDPITVVKTQVSVPVIPVTTAPIVAVNAPTTQNTQISNNLSVKLGIADSGNVNLVSQTTVGQANQVVTLSELKTSSQDNANEKKEIKLDDVRVSLSQNSIVQLVNGGVNLPTGVDQQFYVVRQDINTNSSNGTTNQNSETKDNKKIKGSN